MLCDAVQRGNLTPWFNDAIASTLRTDLVRGLAWFSRLVYVRVTIRFLIKRHIKRYFSINRQHKFDKKPLHIQFTVSDSVSRDWVKHFYSYVFLNPSDLWSFCISVSFYYEFLFPWKFTKTRYCKKSLVIMHTTCYEIKTRVDDFVKYIHEIQQSFYMADFFI